MGSSVQELGAETNVSLFYSQQNTSKGLLFTEDENCLSCLHAGFFYDSEMISGASNKKPNHSGLYKHEATFSSYEKSKSRQLWILVQMLNNVKANISGILLVFLNISSQDGKKEEEDRTVPTSEK